MEMTLHPYYPLGLQIPGYAPNDSSLFLLVGKFSSGLTLAVFVILILASSHRPSMSYGEKLTVSWFALSGILHCFFEGYFITHHDRMGSTQDTLGQLWKEYAKSDSRYLVSDSFVVSIEFITVLLWGPLCLLVAHLTTVNHPLKHPLRIIICMAHLYGDVLYYATSLYDYYVKGISHSRPETLYFWVYYVGMNFVWIIVPAYLMYRSICILSEAMHRYESSGAGKKTR